MLSVNDRVVCIDVEPEEHGLSKRGRRNLAKLERGAFYTIARVGCLDYVNGRGEIRQSPWQAVQLVEVQMEDPDGDAFPSWRFRKLPKLDTSEGMKALKALTAKPRTVETTD